MCFVFPSLFLAHVATRSLAFCADYNPKQNSTNPKQNKPCGPRRHCHSTLCHIIIHICHIIIHICGPRRQCHSTFDDAPETNQNSHSILEIRQDKPCGRKHKVCIVLFLIFFLSYYCLISYFFFVLLLQDKPCGRKR